MEDDKKTTGGNQQFLLGLFAGIAVIAVIGVIVLAIVLITGNRGAVANNPANPAQNQQAQTQPAGGPEAISPTAPGVETFFEKKNAQICKEDGKPVVYLFSTTWCPHCVWVKDIFDKTVAEYVKAGKIKAYHWELDTNDDTLTTAKETSVSAAAQAVYKEFNPAGSIPIFVIGCKYFRVGNGFESQDDLNAEAAELKAAIDAVLK
jgi:thiol-disulfide isomerase/thioredoxin